jgi:hypothetical protein
LLTASAPVGVAPAAGAGRLAKAYRSRPGDLELAHPERRDLHLHLRALVLEVERLAGGLLIVKVPGTGTMSKVTLVPNRL